MCVLSFIRHLIQIMIITRALIYQHCVEKRLNSVLQIKFTMCLSTENVYLSNMHIDVSSPSGHVAFMTCPVALWVKTDTSYLHAKP